MKKIITISVAILVAVLVLVSCTQMNDKSGFEFTLENYPKMGGSLANLPLGEAVTATVLDISREEANSMVVFEGSTTDNYKWLADGRFDIILAYEMSDEAKAYLEEKNVEIEMTPIGTDALVFICSLENKLDSLTDEQIREIYFKFLQNRFQHSANFLNCAKDARR